MKREKFSAEELLLGIYFAKKEVARTRPTTGLAARDYSFAKSLNPDYGRAVRELTNANARARRFCERRAKELASFPIEFGEVTE
jgi:hypothetical protein